MIRAAVFKIAPLKTSRGYMRAEFTVPMETTSSPMLRGSPPERFEPMIFRHLATTLDLVNRLFDLLSLLFVPPSRELPDELLARYTRASDHLNHLQP
jgi:hypothetical protein